MFLTEKFLAQYEGKEPPMTEFGRFVYLRTYARWDEKLGRRERWNETCRRVVEYSLGLEYKHRRSKGLPMNLEGMQAEAEALYDAMINLRQFPSGRSLWVGGTELADKFPLANFNCAFMVISDLYDFCDLFYLLMVGSGVGFRVLEEDMAGFPRINPEVALWHESYRELPASTRLENTRLGRFGGRAILDVGDSKEGWVEALRQYLKLMQQPHITDITICYNSVRPKGERLKTFGGTASGHEGLKVMFQKIHDTLRRNGGMIGALECLDIANIIGENVVSGGVRRTSEMCISNDPAVERAKESLYKQDDAGNWVIDMSILHRRISNNSVWFAEKPDRERLHEVLEKIKVTGEPGFVNAVAARKRRVDFEGLNPCGEILLASHQTCNLSTVNVRAFVEDGKLNRQALFDAMERSAHIGIRMTLVEFELPKWRKVQQQKGRIIGCSLTGWQDMLDACGLSMAEEESLLETLRGVVLAASRRYCGELGIDTPELCTTVKPEGTISQLPTVSSGLHYSHSPYFVRRVRISTGDPLFKACKALGYPMHPEVGQSWDTADTAVLEFPIASGAMRTKDDVGAIEQLSNYKRFMSSYVDHNASITVTVRPEEWAEVEEWLWENWDAVVGVTFLPHYGGVYPLAPYEAITKEEYEARRAALPAFDYSVLDAFDNGQESLLDAQDTADCSTGACPIR